MTPKEAVQIWYDKFGAGEVSNMVVGTWLSGDVNDMRIKAVGLMRKNELITKIAVKNELSYWQLTPEALKLINKP